MDLFEEISKNKKDFPKIHSVKDEVSKYELNFYQVFAIGMFVLCFFLGIVFGSLFSTCTATSYFASNTCVVTEFNYSFNDNYLVCEFINIYFYIWFRTHNCDFKSNK